MPQSPKPVMPRAVLFDLDNTLIDRDRAFRECIEATFRASAVRDELLRLDAHGHGDRDMLLAAWKRHSDDSMTQAQLGARLSERIQPDSHLLEALRELSSTTPLGIITNGGAETQRSKARAAGLDQVIPQERFWVSSEFGRAKPDPAIFLHASRCLGVAPGDCLFVGDHEPHDCAGAAAAGMNCHLVERALDAGRLQALMRGEGLR